MSDADLKLGVDKSFLERQIQDSLSKTYKLTGLNAGSITKPLGEIRGQLGEFEKSLEASNARVVAFGASAGSIYLLSDAIRGLVKSTIDVEKTLADINVILDESDANIKAFGNSLFNIANQTSQTFETAAGAALEFSRQGLGLEKTAQRTADALTLAKISGLSAADSVEALTAAVNSFADSGLTTAQIVNKLAAVDAKYAVSSADLAEAIKRVGSSALDAGVNIDQLIGLVTSAQQTTARGGAVIGNSFKTIFTRLQRPKVLDELKEVGITTQTISGQTLPLIQILTQLASTYDSLSSSQKSQVAELVGGVYQINILKAVLGDLSKEYSVYSGALRESSTATNEAEKRVGSLTQTLSSQLNKVSNNLKRAGSVVGELTIAPALQNILSGANAVLEQFALGKEPEDTGDKVAQGVLKGIGKGLAGPGLVIAAAGFFQLFKRLVLFISDASKTLLGLGAAAQKQLAIQTQVLQLLQQNPSLYKAITSGAISSADAATLYLNAVKATNVELERQRVISAQIAASVPKGVVPPTAAAPVPVAPAPRTTPRMRRRASGFVPNFVDSGAMAEVQEASKHKGGYKAGTPYITTIHDGKGGSFKSWVNSAETVTNFTNAAGYKATMVRPPNGFGPGTEIAAAGYVPNFAFKTIQKPYGDILQGVYGAFTVRGSRNPLDPKKFNISWLEKTQKNSKETFEKYIPAFKKDLSSIGVSSLEYVPLSDDKRDSARSRLFNQLIKKHGFSNGFIPNFANLTISRKELGNLLKTKQFQSITYKKSDGSVARYDAAQHRVRRDKLVGASAPAGHKNWTDYDNATGTIVLHTSKQGETEAKFRRFSVDGIQQLRSGGNTYDVYASGFIPNFAAKNQQTSSPEFKRWFTGSKVVDEKGKHLTVYHGSRSTKDFNTFRTETGYHFGPGAYFTPEPSRASGYAGNAEGARVYPAYLNIKNPYVVQSDASITDLGYKLRKDPANDALIKRVLARYGSNDPNILDNAEIGNAWLRERGYDGVIKQRNRYTENGFVPEIVEAVAFKSEQIKSAIGNRGTFDARNKDIRYANGFIPNFAKKDKYKFPNISSAKMEANIARNFEKLSPGDQKYFARAYEDYNNLIKVFSKASGTSPEKFANVMSALSPANPLERNALDALRYNLFAKKKLSTIASPIFLDEREIGSVKAQTYGANRTKAANLIVGLEKLTGNKRKAFLNNMLDPFGSPDVTVDYRAQGDALNKKFNVKNAPTMNREQYDKVSQAFRNVGSRAGVSGLGVQAATWIGGRMGSKAARGQDFNRGILKFFYDNPDKISLKNLEFLLNVPAKGKARIDFFKKASAMGVSKLGSDSLISISRAGGYIPNFSGLSDAISREKTMTGLPASQIMAHFDGKGNPIAVTNKKDEPNGLKDITNSKGYVPNFAKKRTRYPKKTEPVDPFAAYKSLLKRTNPIAGENVPAPMYSEVAKGQEILAGEDAKKAAREEKAKLAKQKKMLRDIQRREAASGKLIAGVSRNPFTGKFLSKKEVELIRKIKAGQESKAAKLAKQAELIALQKQTRPSGPIFPKSESELKLEKIAAAKYAERGASLSKLASPIFDTSSDPAKQMSAKDLENRLKLTTERPPSANSINAQRRRQAEALKAETLKQAEQNRIRNQIRRQQEAAGAIAREAEAGRKAQRAAYAASLQRPKRMGVTRQARLIENLETSQRSRLLPSGPTVSSAGMERAQRKLQERRAREEARDIRRQANEQQTARTQAGMRLAGYYGKGVQPAGVAPTATPAGTTPSTGGGGGRGPRLPVTPPAGSPPAGGPPGGGPPNNPPNNGGGTSSAAQERYRRRFGDRAFFKRFGGGQPGGMKSFATTLGLALTFQNAPEILNTLGVSGIYADEKQSELTAKGQRIQTFGNIGAMASMYASPAVTNALGQLPGKLIPETIKKPFGGITKMGETLNRIPGMSKLGNLGKKLPGLGTTLTLGMGAYSGVQARESGATLEESLMIGLVPAITSLIGSSIGAAIGTFAGGPVGTVAGGVGGFALGEKLGNKIVKSTSRFTVGEERLAKFQENRRLATKFQEESRMYSGSKAATMGLAAEKIRTFDIQKESSESEAEYTRKIKQSSDEYLKLRKDQAAQIIQDIGGINYASKLLSDSGNNIDAFRKQIAKTYMTTGQKEKGGFFTDTISEEATKRATEQTKLIVKTLKDLEERKAVAPLMKEIGKSLDLFAAKARFVSAVVKGFREKDFARGQNLLKNVGGGVEGFLNPEKLGSSFESIVSSLKVLNDPRLAKNSIERGRAAFNLMENAGQMGIDFTDADRKRLSALITKGFETQIGQIDIGLSRLGGQFFNDYGLRRGITQSQIVSGEYQRQNKMNTAEAALTADSRMSMAGYVNPLEAKYGMASDAIIRGSENTSKAFELVSRQVNALGEAAQSGAISVKEFSTFAEQIRNIAQTGNQNNSEQVIAKLNEVINSLSTTSQQILAQQDINKKPEVTGSVEIKFAGLAETYLKAAEKVAALYDSNKLTYPK